MSYYKQGYNCTPRTFDALTSNRKFLSPNTAVYALNRATAVYRYPGDLGIFGNRARNDADPRNPEHMVAYLGKNSSPYERPNEPPVSSCPCSRY